MFVSAFLFLLVSVAFFRVVCKGKHLHMLLASSSDWVAKHQIIQQLGKKSVNLKRAIISLIYRRNSYCIKLVLISICKMFLKYRFLLM